VFERIGTVVRIPITAERRTAEQASALETLAQSRGVGSASLIQEWVQKNIALSS
jgi:hypothetical protein